MRTPSAFEGIVFKFYKEGSFSEKATAQLDIVFSGKPFFVTKNHNSLTINTPLVFRKGCIVKQDSDEYSSVVVSHILEKIILGEFSVK